MHTNALTVTGSYVPFSQYGMVRASTQEAVVDRFRFGHSDVADGVAGIALRMEPTRQRSKRRYRFYPWSWAHAIAIRPLCFTPTTLVQLMRHVPVSCFLLWQANLASPETSAIGHHPFPLAFSSETNELDACTCRPACVCVPLGWVLLKLTRLSESHAIQTLTI